MNIAEAQVLTEERKCYERARERLLAQHEGKFALIHGSELVGVYDSGRSAYEDGLRRLGNVPMLIVQVVRKPPVEVASPALHLGLLRAGPYA